MKIQKKLTAGIIGAMMFLAIGASSASAGAECTSATVTKTMLTTDVAPGRTMYGVYLDCDDDNKWAGERRFFLTTDLGEAGYATALTAISLEKKVKVLLGSTTANSLLYNITMQ